MIKDAISLVEDYPKVVVTVDCAIFGFEENELKILLICGDLEMYKGKWSLLGDIARGTEEWMMPPTVYCTNEPARRMCTWSRCVRLAPQTATWVVGLSPLLIVPFCISATIN